MGVVSFSSISYILSDRDSGNKVKSVQWNKSKYRMTNVQRGNSLVDLMPTTQLYLSSMNTLIQGGQLRFRTDFAREECYSFRNPEGNEIKGTKNKSHAKKMTSQWHKSCEYLDRKASLMTTVQIQGRWVLRFQRQCIPVDRKMLPYFRPSFREPWYVPTKDHLVRFSYSCLSSHHQSFDQLDYFLIQLYLLYYYLKIRFVHVHFPDVLERKGQGWNYWPGQLIEIRWH